MAKNKCYGVVLNNGETGVFTSWPEAQTFIATCPSNARYKGFTSMADAKVFIGAKTQTMAETETATTVSDPGVMAIAYVDGSFNSETGVWGAGAVVMDAADKTIQTELTNSGTAYNKHRNVTGEVYAAMMAVKHARNHGYKSIVIYHDYQGISSWVNGLWRTNEEMTKLYKGWMLEQTARIEIHFEKVKAHSGVEHNEQVDRLAKSAAGVA